jgi:hypothetical protein
MPFSEDDLRSALRLKDPSPDFTDKVMARLGEQPAQKEQGLREREGFSLLRWPVMMRWAMAGAVAAVFILGLGLQQYQRRQQQARAEQARRQTILALQITAQKMDHVFHRASRTPAPSPAHDNDKEQL